MLLLITQAPAPLAAPDPVKTLLDALSRAPDAVMAGRLETAIRTEWQKSIPPSAALLLTRAYEEHAAGAGHDADTYYKAAIDIEPGNAELWFRRAQARLAGGDLQGAAADDKQAVSREPREFQAWEALSRIAELRGDWHGALTDWQKLLDFDPHTPGGDLRLRALRERVAGEAL